MSGESDSDFVKSVEEHLEASRISEAKAIFCADKYKDNLKNNCWDIIPAVSKFLVPQSKFEVFNCSKQFLCSIADISNPEEALLQFIEEIEEADSDIKFVALLEPLRKVLFRIPRKFSISLSWGFNSIECYLEKYEFPDSENLQGKEKLLLDNTEENQSINELYKSLLQFYDLLIQDILCKTHKTDYLIILKFLLRLLGRPLVYQDVEIFNDIKSRARLSSEYLVGKIFEICFDPILILNYRYIKENDIYKLNNLGLASLYYLIFVENVCIDKVPKVYDSVYFFQNSLYLVTIFFKINHQIVVEKGLKLAGSLLKYIPKSKLSYLLLDSSDHEDFCKSLSNIIIYNELENFRKLGLEVYHTYLSKFETKGFYSIIYNLFSHITHSGLKSYTITLYKDLVVREFENLGNIFIRGPKLLTLLRKFCFLHKNEESDLVEISDEIIATLNLLRFLTIKDKLNSSKIWDYIPILEKIYLEPLKKGIVLSRAHYKLKIKEIEEENPAKKVENDVNVIVKGESLSKLSKIDKIEVLNYSLTVFDVIDSLLSRLKECIELQEQ